MKILMSALILMMNPNFANAGGCEFELLSAQEHPSIGNADANKGIATSRTKPLNTTNWKISTPPRDIGSYAKSEQTEVSSGDSARNPKKTNLRPLSVEQERAVELEIASINEMLGSAFSIPTMPRVVISVEGDGFYVPEENLIAVPLIRGFEGSLAGIDVGVLRHEYGHAIYAANYKGAPYETSWELGYEEVFADAVTLMRFHAIWEMKQNAGAFATSTPVKGWTDREEHQIFIPARSAMGNQLWSNSNQTVLTRNQRQAFLRAIFDSGNQERESHRSVMTTIGQSALNLKASPESLNDSFIQRFLGLFR